jgi:peptidoglycan-associated lipoprotein
MKRSLWLCLALTLIVAVAGPTGCRKKPKSPTPIPGARTGTGDSGIYGREPGTALAPEEGATGQALAGGGGGGGALPTDIETGMKRDEGFFKSNTVYFDFDRSTILAGERPKIEGVASHLKGNTSHKVKVEGHRDERGTEGYNLALGERRALAVREYLVNLGISPDRVTTTSFGEARPADPGHGDAAWAKNRRAEFILLVP